MAMNLNRHIIQKILFQPISRVTASYSNIEPSLIKCFFEELYGFLTCTAYKQYKHKRAFLLIVDPSLNETTNNNKIFSDFFNRYPQNNIFMTNFYGALIDSEYSEITDDINMINDDSEANPDKLYIYVDFFCIEILGKNKHIHRIYNVNNANNFVSEKKALSIQDYRLAVEQHYQNNVVDEKNFNYWSNKKERILINRPEKHFHKDLAAYLDSYIVDAQITIESSNARGNDKLDICMLKHDSKDVYIIEVKWIGKSISIQNNESKCGKGHTEYLLADMCNAFKQLNIYLNSNGHAKCGALVIYDASQMDEELKCVEIKDLNPYLDEKPLKFYLISKSASALAKQ